MELNRNNTLFALGLMKKTNSTKTISFVAKNKLYSNHKIAEYCVKLAITYAFKNIVYKYIQISQPKFPTGGVFNQIGEATINYKK